MRPFLCVCVLAFAACGSGSSKPATADLASSHDLANAPVDSSMPSGDLASVSGDLASGDLSGCAPPGGTTCPPTSGNCLGIGMPCTKGGNECAAAGDSCDKDLNASGVGACIKPFGCTPGMHQCGTGASCCSTASTSNIPVCIANQCLPSDCTAE